MESTERASRQNPSSWEKVFKVHPETRLNELLYKFTHDLEVILDNNMDDIRTLWKYTQLSHSEVERYYRQPTPTATFLRITGGYGWRIKDLANLLLKERMIAAANVLLKDRPASFVNCDECQKYEHVVPFGSSIVVKYPAHAHPPPRYRWYRLESNSCVRRLLYENNNCEFRLAEAAGSEHAGDYEVVIDSPAFIAQNQKKCFKVVVQGVLPNNAVHSSTFGSQTHEIHAAADVRVQVTLPIRQRKLLARKVALLIGNYDYENLEYLSAVPYDLNILQEDLEKAQFLVMKLVNLNKAEIMHAIQALKNILSPQVYVFIYLGGHGYSLSKYSLEAFLIPTETLPIFSPQDCVSTFWIKSQLLTRSSPGLLFLCNDFCLKPEIGFKKSSHENVELQSKDNLVEYFATHPGGASHETAYHSFLSSALHNEIIDGVKNQILPTVEIFARKVAAHVNKYSEIAQSRLKNVRQNTIWICDVYTDKSLFDPVEDHRHGCTTVENHVDNIFRQIFVRRQLNLKQNAAGWIKKEKVNIRWNFPKDNIMEVEIEPNENLYRQGYGVNLLKQKLDITLNFKCKITNLVNSENGGVKFCIEHLQKLATVPHFCPNESGSAASFQLPMLLTKRINQVNGCDYHQNEILVQDCDQIEIYEDIEIPPIIGYFALPL